MSDFYLNANELDNLPNNSNQKDAQQVARLYFKLLDTLGRIAVFKLFCKILVLIIVSMLLSSLTFIDQEVICPVDAYKFTFSKVTSGYLKGQRLDTRELGALACPKPLPLCPKCKAILYKSIKETYSSAEIEALRKLIYSDSYKKLSPQTILYERLALIYKGIGEEPELIAMSYLRASWESESIVGGEAETKRLIIASIKYLDLFLEKSSINNSSYTTYEFLKGELLRRLGKFAVAKNYFERLKKDQRYENGIFKDMVTKELELISQSDSRPH